MKRYLLLILVQTAFGCGPSEESGKSPTYCEVRPIVENKCLRCHTDDGDAETPFNLETYEEVIDRISDVEREVQRGTMPLRLNLEPEVEPLTTTEKDTILAWIDAGAPPGDCE